MSTPIVLDINTWSPAQFRCMPAKINAQGGKAISIISNQTGRSLHISTPMMTTWGINDFTDPATGVSDGKFNISLSFPNDQYKTEKTDLFLEKMRQLEQAMLDAAVVNSETWFGKKKSRELVEDSFYPILKFPKDKVTKQIDKTKMPSISAKVPYYEKDGKWNVEIYDTKGELQFPNANEELEPTHFVPKLSTCAAVLQCGGIWIGGKGWGVTWKLVQAVVKPKMVETVFGRCQIKLDDEEQKAIENHDVEEAQEVENIPAPIVVNPVVQTQVPDSDEETEKPITNPVVNPVVKKVVKAPVSAPIVEAPVSEPVVEAPVVPVKKVLKKVAPK